MNFNTIYYFTLFIPLIHLIYYQSYKLNINNENDCLSKFKSNNILGLIILIILFIGKIF